MPLVSCIMPTKNRPEFVPKAIEYFGRQTYPNKELVVLDDGMGLNMKLVTERFRYRRISPGLTLGAKRNRCVEYALGDLIAHWDDDDWYGPERLAHQVAVMTSGFDLCGLSNPLFYDLRTGRSYTYSHSSVGSYLYSATLMYTRTHWERSSFPDLQVGASTPFVMAPGNRGLISDSAWYVGMAHDSNNSPKPFTAREFTPCFGDMKVRLGADWPFYQSLRANMGVAA